MSNGKTEKRSTPRRKRKRLSLKEFRVQSTALDFEELADMIRDGGDSKEGACEAIIRFADWLKGGCETECADMENLKPYPKSFLRRLCAAHYAHWVNYSKNWQEKSAPDDVSAPEIKGKGAYPTKDKYVNDCARRGIDTEWAAKFYDDLKSFDWTDGKGNKINDLMRYTEVSYMEASQQQQQSDSGGMEIITIDSL